MRVYLAGPMRHHPLYNFQAFEDAAHWITLYRDWRVISPHEIDIVEGLVEVRYTRVGDRRIFNEVALTERFSFPVAIKRDLAALLQCEAIVMLPGWEQSEGARIEDQVREWCGMPRLLYMPNHDFSDPTERVYGDAMAAVS